MISERMAAQVAQVGRDERQHTRGEKGQRSGGNGSQVGWDARTDGKHVDVQIVFEGPDGNQRHPVHQQQHTDGNNQDPADDFEDRDIA